MKAKNIYVLKDLYGRYIYRLMMGHQGETRRALISFTNKKEAIRYARKEFGYITENKSKCIAGCLIEKFRK